MTRLWNIEVFIKKGGVYCVKIIGGQGSAEGTGKTAHQAYTAAESKLIIKPWLTSEEL